MYVLNIVQVKYIQLYLFPWAYHALKTFKACNSSVCVWRHEAKCFSCWVCREKWTLRPANAAWVTASYRWQQKHAAGRTTRWRKGKRQNRGRTKWRTAADGARIAGWWRGVDLVLLLCSIRRTKRKDKGERGRRSIKGAVLNCLFTH